jgi:8-oxo-dGTP pyrophosphatase MutT (NUDIX family)
MHSFNAFNALKDKDASDDDDDGARDDGARDDGAMKPPLFHTPFIKKTTFCNNCGKNGHPMHACKNPIISNGMIVFKHGNEGASSSSSYLMIRRKDTLGFVEFIRGKYPIYNQKHVQRLIDEMTVDEKHRLQTQTFSELWKNVWGDYLNSKYQNEEAVSCDRFNLLKSGIRETPRNGVNYTLSSLIAKSSTQWAEPEWGFPKGRRNYQEKDIDCALREFSEETGYDKTRLVVMQNVIPYEEIFMGSNMKTYKHRYYVAHMTQAPSDPPPAFQKTEVSKMAWFSYDQCIQHIRPYNLEKLNILRNLNNARMEHAIVGR